VTLDFSTKLVQVVGGISLQFGSYISISGGFDYTQTSGTGHEHRPGQRGLYRGD